jgi:hypothetical protein
MSTCCAPGELFQIEERNPFWGNDRFFTRGRLALHPHASMVFVGPVGEFGYDLACRSSQRYHF